MAENIQVGMRFTNEIVIVTGSPINPFFYILNSKVRFLNGRKDELFDFATVNTVHIAFLLILIIIQNLNLNSTQMQTNQTDRLDGASGRVAIIIPRRIKQQLFSSFGIKISGT